MINQNPLAHPELEKVLKMCGIAALDFLENNLDSFFAISIILSAIGLFFFGIDYLKRRRKERKNNKDD